MEHRTEADAIAALAFDATAPDALDAGTIYAAPDGAGGIRVIDTDAYAERPRRKEGTRVTIEPTHLVAYLDKHGRPETELWASRSAGTITAIIDAHGATEPGWGKHVCALKLTHTPDWVAFTKADRQWMSQSTFAEFVQDNLAAFVAPASAVMLELAQSFQAARKVAFESGKRLSSGETTLVYREQIDAKAGRKGEVVIPDTLTLALQPYEGSKVYKVGARFRYRITDEALAMSIALDRPDDVLRDAFGSIVEQVADGSGREIWLTS